MDENVHLASRLALLCRLCLSLIIIVIGSFIIMPIPSITDADPGDSEAITDVMLPIRQTVPLVFKRPIITDAIATARQERFNKTKVKLRFREIIQQVSARHGIESAMIKAIIMAESGYNPYAVSNRGAVGLMQLMPTTADFLGVKDRFDPHHNIDGGVRYFKRLLNRFEGNIRLALAAYNAGAERVRRYNGIPPYKATQIYIDKVFQYYQRYKDLENAV